MLQPTPPPDSYKVLFGYKKAIEEELAKFFSKDFAKLLGAGISPFGLKSIELLKEFNLRPAKRLRGALTALTYDITTNQHKAKAGLQAAAAIELIQDYLLIIDDVMDQSKIRRGGDSIHVQYKKMGIKTYTAQMMAIDLGIIAQHLSNMLLLDIKIEPKILNFALWQLHRNIELTGFGQMDDLYQDISKPLTETDVIRMFKLKSSYYTFINPMQVGAILGGVTNKGFLEEIEEYGENAGIAFQLKDDLLGLYGDSATTGKPVGDDLKEGKYTLLVENALKNAEPTDANYIKSILGKDISKEEVMKAQEIVIRSGAKSYTEKTMENYGNNAISIVKNSKYWDENSKKLFCELVLFAEGRIK